MTVEKNTYIYIYICKMLQEVKLKAKKQLGNLFAKENDGLSRHEK